MSCSIKWPVLNNSKKSLSNNKVHLRKNWTYCFVSGLPRPIFGPYQMTWSGYLEKSLCYTTSTIFFSNSRGLERPVLMIETLEYHGSSKETIGIVIVFTLAAWCWQEKVFENYHTHFLLNSISKCNSLCSKIIEYVVYDFEQKCFDLTIYCLKNDLSNSNTYSTTQQE